jgi:hypothetical protein
VYKPNPPSPRFELPPRADLFDSLKQGVLIGAAALTLLLPPDGSAWQKSSHSTIRGAVRTPASVALRAADFKGQPASSDARQVADWVVRTRDNQHLSFVILDKREARLFVFDAKGQMRGSTPVLLGAAVGDDSVEGIGNRPIAQVRPEERTTPAGRFIAEPGRNSLGEDVVWVDYHAAVSMHRVRALEPRERRLERLASPTAADNRISYGCINVPLRFYEDLLRPTFRQSRGVVYVLPESKPLQTVFRTDQGSASANPAVKTAQR